MAAEKLCSVDGCGKRRHAHGFCANHNYRFTAHGDPLAGRRGASHGAPLKWLKDNAKHSGDDCLPWPFEISRWGYGTVKVDGVRRVASRLMCEIVHGAPVHDRLDAAHSCNNRACCNPKHLRWATRRENNLDMHDAGTAMRGEKVVFAKLSEAEVVEILALGGTTTQAEIAERYRVRSSTISRILSGKRWGWLKNGNNIHRSNGGLCDTDQRADGIGRKAKRARRSRACAEGQGFSG